MVNKSVKAMEKSQKSDPIVIAKLIKKAVESENPKTRYVDGYNAKMLLFLRSVLSDKIFDKLMLSQLK